MSDADFKIIIKEAVKDAVTYCGSQVALADKAGITQGAIGKYLRGDAMPTGVTAKKLSQAVDSTISRDRFAPHIFDDIGSAA